jgi:hypothetical protein
MIVEGRLKMAKELGTGTNNFFEEFRNADEAS